MEQADFKQALAQFRERIENDMIHGMNHDMIEHDNLCHEGNNSLICNDHVMSEPVQLKKSDWWYLVNTLTEWRVYNARSVVKRNPRLAWKVMNLCKDKRVRVKGAYFTTCFRRELSKLA